MNASLMMERCMSPPKVYTHFVEVEKYSNSTGINTHSSSIGIAWLKVVIEVCLRSYLPKAFQSKDYNNLYFDKLEY